MDSTRDSKGRPAAPGEKPAAVAARLLAQGFHPVAIKPGEKRPIGVGWGLERPTVDQLHERYAKSPGAGVGICLGPGKAPGGRWLVDLEGDGESAEAALEALMGGELVSTMGWTSRRGLHRLFVVGDDFLDALRAAGAVEGRGASAGVFHLAALPDLEFRVGGTKPDGTVKQLQSVVPPTIGEDGKPREWNGCPSVAEMPASALATLRALAESAPAPEEERRPTAARAPAPHEAGSRAERYARAGAEKELALLAGTGEGGRNHQLNVSAMKLGQLVGAGVLPEGEAVEGLRDACRRNGLGDGPDALATIRSGMAKGLGEPRDLSGVGSTTGKAGRGGEPSTNGTGRGVKATAPLDREELNARLANRPRTDLGNAERMTARFGGDARFCGPWGRWLIWDGKRYADDRTGAIDRFAKRTAREILAEAATIVDDDSRKAHVVHARATESRARLESMKSLAATEEGVPILPDEMDRDAWLFNVANGTIDLRTGEIRPHDRADFITQLCPIVFDPYAKCPHWESTLELFFGGDQKLIAYWQRLCGYALVGLIRDHVMPVAYGDGSNGKSTILGTLLEVFGPDYAMKAPASFLMAKVHDPHPTDRADLFRKRLVVAIETEDGRRLDETMVKELTGGDEIRARRMREDHWQFKPTHTLFMGTNHRPTIRGTDHGIWRRLKLVPFSVKVDGDKADTSMAEKLRAEFPGILAWCVRGCLAWQEIGLNEPDSVKDATSAYRSEQDVLGTFLSECTAQVPGTRTRCQRLYDAYSEWSEKAGERPVTMKRFGQAMKERGFQTVTSNGKWYVEIGLNEAPKGESKERKDNRDDVDWNNVA